MKNKKNLLILIASIIGITCTAICLCILFKDRIKESALFQKFFGDDDDLDMDFFDEEFMDDDEEDDDVTEIVEEAEEEVQAPKARRGYIPLKFPNDQIA